MENLLLLTWRLLDEEIKVINNAYKSIMGGKLIYAKDRTFLIRYLSRNKKNCL